jgi:hypothetical protein
VRGRFSHFDSLTIVRTAKTFRPVNRLRVFVLIALAACWLPATLHCALEAAEIVPSHCCDSPDAGAAPDDCQDEMCCAWESAFAHPVAAPLLKAPDAAFVCTLSAAMLVDPLSPVIESPIAPPSPPIWLPAWQFEHRTALPVRAPALT